MSQQGAKSMVDGSKQPWWKEPTMWLVVGGPTIVVIASFVTLGLALKFPDAVIEDRGQGADAGQTAAEAKVPGAALAPAMKARNHAATGGQ